MLRLDWHRYKYYPYEQQLAVREVERLLGPKSVTMTDFGIIVEAPSNLGHADRLVYFASKTHTGEPPATPTQQALLERVNGNGPNRQSTRYSAHGLHEYKGKFNPQIAKALLNIFGVSKGQWALDPFCGSGTSLVEAAHLGINAVGADLNPLAVFLANTKIKALGTPADAVLTAAGDALRAVRRFRRRSIGSDDRAEYLAAWFPSDVLLDIEKLKAAILLGPEQTHDILLALASNILRDYSLQEPSDLRIRRRTSPMPDVAYLAAFENSVAVATRKLADSQSILGPLAPSCQATRLDCRQSLQKAREVAGNRFDVALTSPPYATALPYIDTQRLSLVWLDLLAPTDILALEASLVGSREIRGQSRTELLEALAANESELPEAEARLCVRLQKTLTAKDGFRRQAVPRLLYRYFGGMADSFQQVRAVMKPGAMYGLIVGGNHTVLGGKRCDIDTPAHLASIATSRGWTHVETVGLQTYRRFGLHVRNAGTTEALVILKA